MGFVDGVLITVLSGLWGLFSGVPYIGTLNNGDIRHRYAKLRVAELAVGLPGRKRGYDFCFF